MSVVSVVLPIVGAVDKTEEQLGGNANWKPQRPEQAEFLGYYPRLRKLCKVIPELSSSAEVFWAGSIYSIKVQCLMDITVHWQKEGTRQDILHADTKVRYDGVRIGGSEVQFYWVNGHPHPIACLPTKTKDLVYLTMFPRGDYPVRTLDKIVTERFQPCQLRHADRGELGGLQFPMVNLHRVEQISWLLGMQGQDADGYSAEIVEASQDTKLRLNQIGARVRSEVHLRTRVITCCAPSAQPPDHIINQPFLVWFVRPSIPYPYAIAWVTEGDWKDPGNLQAE